MGRVSAAGEGAGAMWRGQGLVWRGERLRRELRLLVAARERESAGERANVRSARRDRESGVAASGAAVLQHIVEGAITGGQYNFI